MSHSILVFHQEDRNQTAAAEWKAFPTFQNTAELNLINLYAKLDRQDPASTYEIVSASTYDPVVQAFKSLAPALSIMPFMDPIHGPLPYMLYRHYHLPKSQIAKFLALYYDINAALSKDQLKEVAYSEHALAKLHPGFK